MFGAKTILIVEDETLIAMDLAAAVVELDGEVVGPLATVREALLLIDSQVVAAAILDARLQDRDITPVALRLAECGIPFVVHSATGLPTEVAARCPDVPVLIKPTPALAVVKRLWDEIQKQGNAPD
ncbi:response regulator [Novosphingobium lentum]|uniref:response regulator n=1 Tax=Novosphingobium lentum TaxID=145287 RepID=UPI000ABBEAF1|nr:response regulator [Novosphingobium lentum]